MFIRFRECWGTSIYLDKIFVKLLGKISGTIRNFFLGILKSFDGNSGEVARNFGVFSGKFSHFFFIFWFCGLEASYFKGFFNQQIIRRFKYSLMNHFPYLNEDNSSPNKGVNLFSNPGQKPVHRRIFSSFVTIKSTQKIVQF